MDEREMREAEYRRRAANALERIERLQGELERLRRGEPQGENSGVAAQQEEQEDTGAIAPKGPRTASHLCPRTWRAPPHREQKLVSNPGFRWWIPSHRFRKGSNALRGQKPSRCPVSTYMMARRTPTPP